jgi:hypothetical protein
VERVRDELGHGKKNPPRPDLKGGGKAVDGNSSLE